MTSAMSDSDRAMSRLEAISTRWTLLREAHGGPGTASREARQALVLRYLPAVRRYVQAIVQKEHDAEDLAQDLVVRLLASDFAGADPGRGRFRDLLKTAIRNMVRDHWSRQKRRRSVAYDVGDEPSREGQADDDAWTVQWRHQVLDLVWNAFRNQQRGEAGKGAYALLRLRAEHPDDSSEELAARYAAKTGEQVRADAVRQKLRRARLQFADLLLVELAKGFDEPTAEKIEDELVALGLVDIVRDLLPEDWRDRYPPRA